MKKSFTIIELLIVIVIIGIIASFSIPRISKGNLIKAADQIISHIRYTQHLALIDDKFDPTDENWFKKRWVFAFTNINTKEKIKSICENVNCWRYNVYQNIAGNGTSNINNLNSIKEVARDPLNSSLVLSAGFSPSSMSTKDIKQLNLKLNIQKEYGINNIEFQGNCQTNAKSKKGIKIIFDELGRPYYGNPKSAYENNLLTNTCIIKLIRKDECIKIYIEPQTGYTHKDISCSINNP